MGLVLAAELVEWSCQRATVPGAGSAQTPPAAAAPVGAVAVPTGAAPKPAGAAAQPAAGDASRVAVQVTEEGFVPSHIPAKVGQPITLVITRKTDRTCAREILFKGQPGKTELPLDKAVEATFTPTASGEVPFGCAMGMMVGGKLEVK
jgi:plastocyanin domain-containing protein